MTVRDEEDRDIIPNHRSPTSLRLVTFNVNGTKTLKNYHPWSSLGSGSLNDYFEYMKADVVTLQELKLQMQDVMSNIHSIATLANYKSFVTVPVTKKGYSGVGVFIRTPTKDDPELLQKALTVIKAEEGITGYLKVPSSGKFSEPKQTYREAELESPGAWIGGYPDLTDIDEEMTPLYAHEIDSQGRCMMVELNFNVVIISVYCPANSMCTEEGERFRQMFLKFLFERAKKLIRLGKEVIVMGDINVSVNLIDSDEWLKEGFKESLLVRNTESQNEMEDFEKLNKDYVLEFKESTDARKIINSYVFDTTGLIDDSVSKCHTSNGSPILYDVCRERQERKLKLYTVWNTFKNTRPMNIGSRIDLILTSEKLRQSVNDSNIWAFLYGSDHCPVYADFEMVNFYKSLSQTEDCKVNLFDSLYSQFKDKKNPIEAKAFYKLQVGKGIDSFFKAKPAKREVETTASPSPSYQSDCDAQCKDNRNSTYISRKKRKNDGHLPINSFFVSKANKNEQPSQTSTKSDDSVSSQSLDDSSVDKKVTAIDFMSMISSTGSNIPKCEHDEPCVLRSVKNQSSANKGKKFWCCSRNTKNDTWNVVTEPTAPDSEFSCGYFKWAYK